MHREHWRLLEEHFHAAIRLPEPRRAIYLDHVRRVDPPLHRDLEGLLVAGGAMSRFLEDTAPIAPTTDETTSSLAPGARLAHWRIVRLLGRGGTGEVYEVRSVSNGSAQRAALKLVSATSHRVRSHNEQHLLACLRHPGIPRLLDTGETHGAPYFVMELVEGEPISTHCEQRDVGARERLTLFLQLCEIVAHLHRLSIAHGDIKPGNVLVGSDGRVRLVDFGSAAALGTTRPRRPAVHLTPDYAAPEQLAGAPASAEADVHALGIVLYELLVGRRPWIGAGGLTFRAIHDVLIGAAPPASEAVMRSPRTAPATARFLHGRLDSIIATCLRQQPMLRYGSAGALARDVAVVLAARETVPPVKRARSPLSAPRTFGRARYRLSFRPRGGSVAPLGEGRRRAKYARSCARLLTPKRR